MIKNLKIEDFSKEDDIGFQASSNGDIVLKFLQKNYNVTGFTLHGNHFEENDDPSFVITIDNIEYTFSDIINTEKIIKELDYLIKCHKTFISNNEINYDLDI